MRKLMLLILAANTLLVFSACNKDDDNDMVSTPTQKNIVQTAMAADNLSILVDALQQAGLVDALNATGPFTVFAPTNDAFQDLLDSNPAWNSLSDIDNATLTSVLLFHVVSGRVKAADLSNTYVATLSPSVNSEPLSLQVHIDGSVTFNGSAMPVTTDINASNGVVHIINKVMLPPSVVDLALNNPALSSLVAALTRADLTTDYVSILSAAGPYTVFAPTNAAFDALLASNPAWNTLGDIPVATLEAVLNYHVLNGANVQADQLTDEQQVTTLGGAFTIDLSSGAQIKTTSGQTANIVLTDIQGTNGVVHVVDMVLLP